MLNSLNTPAATADRERLAALDRRVKDLRNEPNVVKGYFIGSARRALNCHRLRNGSLFSPEMSETDYSRREFFTPKSACPSYKKYRLSYASSL